jgi:hypothetical protein
MVIAPHNARYLLAQYETEDGKYVTAQLPKGIPTDIAIISDD